LIAVDTNILVYAHREEFDEHKAALTWLNHLARGNVPWGLPVFALGEFIRVVTHPRIFDPPTSLENAIGALQGLLSMPSLRVLGPDRAYPSHLMDAIRIGRTAGNLAFDAQIASVCREHGVGRLLTRDRDFSRFPWIEVVDLDAEPRDLESPPVR
jgi:toxin-antitoxin system PIN domain toxin